ncbi:hypothetical protein QE390_003154 [Siphonobacter sp. SORGH_AS 1065]|nr:hypothetical protein [Siphonobacter sp. SORGH_AS_1065]
MIRLIHIPITWLIRIYILKLRKKDQVRPLAVNEVLVLRYLILSLKSINAVHDHGWLLSKLDQAMVDAIVKDYIDDLNSEKNSQATWQSLNKPWEAIDYAMLLLGASVVLGCLIVGLSSLKNL